jgi:hypothetical protein
MTVAAPTPSCCLEPATQTPIAMAIAKANAAADIIAAKVPAMPRRPAVVLSCKEWHDILQALTVVVGELRTEQILKRRGVTP